MCVLAKKLNLLNVLNALKDVPVARYTDVGLALGVNLKQIQVFEANNNRDVERVWKEILQYWLDSSSSLTWKTLAETLLASGFTSYASIIAVLK